MSKETHMGVGKPVRGTQDAPRPQTFLYSGGTCDHVGVPNILFYPRVSRLPLPNGASASRRSVLGVIKCVILQ